MNYIASDDGGNADDNYNGINDIKTLKKTYILNDLFLDSINDVTKCPLTLKCSV